MTRDVAAPSVADPSVAADVPRLASLTTIQLGGPAAGLETARTAGEVVELVGAADRAGGALVLGGGSNLVVADRGVDIPLIRVAVPGISVDRATGVAVLGAGVAWDDAVAELVAGGWCGVEALSGIPGSVGATPVQNVGAYGVEIADVLLDSDIYWRHTGVLQRVPASELGLTYRHSVLKGADLGVVTQVRLQLRREAAPVRYPELARLLGVAVGASAPAPAVREAVIALRRSKAMVLDPADRDSASAGSFFTNPVVSADELTDVRNRVADRLGPDVRMPEYPVHGAAKLSAAWLIEKAGFPKGYPLGERPDAGIALSTKHTLALTNRGSGSTEELVALARQIRDGVHAAFGVTLQPEPVLVGCSLD